MVTPNIEAGETSKTILSVIIPVYNEAKNLPILFNRLKTLQLQIDCMKLEILFIDDHSTDNSPEILKTACLKNSDFRTIRLSRNNGSHIAILAGLEYAEGDCAVFIASDLQDPPELIPKMLHLWREGNHVVWAIRGERKGISLFEKYFSSAFYYLLNRLGKINLPPQGSDFALIDREIIRALLRSVGVNPSLGGEIARLGFKQAQIVYTKEARRFGQSKWSLERKLFAFADAFVSFSYKPLRIMSYFGIASSLIGFLYAIIIVFIRLNTDTPIAGWASLMVVVLMLGGIQMTMMGISGEYLWRTLEAARKRPLYFVERTIGLDKDAVETSGERDQNRDL